MGMFEDAQAQVHAADQTRRLVETTANAKEQRLRKDEEAAVSEYIDAMARLGIGAQTHDYLFTGIVRVNGHEHPYVFRSGKTVDGWNLDNPRVAVQGPSQWEAKRRAKSAAKHGGPSQPNDLQLIYSIVVSPNGLASNLLGQDNEYSHLYGNGGAPFESAEPWRFQRRMRGGHVDPLSELLRSSLVEVMRGH